MNLFVNQSISQILFLTALSKPQIARLRSQIATLNKAILP